MDFEEFTYDTVEMIDFDLHYYWVALTKPLVMERLENGEPYGKTTFRKDHVFEEAYYLLESKVMVFKTDGDEYQMKVKLSLS